MNIAIHTFSEKDLGPCLDGDKAILSLLSIEEMARACTASGQDFFASHYLGAAERKRLDSYSFLKRRLEWLAGRIAAKKCVLEMFPDRKWLDLEIAADPRGRPRVGFRPDPDMRPPDISISHSHGLAAAMAVPAGTCGVDIQKAVPSVIKIQERFASSLELNLLRRALPEMPGEETLLTMLWAAKESLRKAANTSPLPGFLELRLIGATPLPDTSLYRSGAALHFAGIPGQVVTGMRGDFAVAFAVSP